mmetsp:Transcript_17317/g.29112  ORF Transcript_17317/g.29112 Transcript_17317/m.29112 type:complete len:199 (-) Transcript_17317:302-898(-)|eukprot:CAMPEP_0198210296 /NCGR_PEP_ID=MMETSP1445-20131203/20014_1 /TAXON_ID=36898 /ORGANISM="Pyramimonas sp., Strain CCMP2087" /LENGTH=198 /DNA_ID=CAMNT_0043884319 /DNA_START=77 /DNA_END=673 /DNA_ORIENTATION=-
MANAIMQGVCFSAKTNLVTQRRSLGKHACVPATPAFKATHRASISCSSASEEVNVGRRSVAIGSGIAALSGVLGGSLAPEAMAKDKVGVYWISPTNNATVESPVKVKMGVKGLEVVPAARGPVEGSGHHHIVVDGKESFVKPGEAIPFDATHLHFGKGQTEAEIELSPGKHKLLLQFANYKHESYGKATAKVITINVK